MISPHHPHHKPRYYVVIITLLVAGIFLFLFANNGKEGFSLTGALVGDSEELTEILDADAKDGLSEEAGEDSVRKIGNNANEVNLDLTYDHIPSVENEAKLEEIELQFADLNTKVNVNDDKLELNNLKAVNLKIAEFVGSMDFNELGISVEGKAKRIEVNNIALSSKEDMKISFEDLDYQFLNIKGLELKELELSDGDGSLSVDEKLQYELSNEGINIYRFNGELIIDRGNLTGMSLSGTAKGLSVLGESLSFSLS